MSALTPSEAQLGGAFYAGTAAVYTALTDQQAKTGAKTEAKYRKPRQKTRGRRL